MVHQVAPCAGLSAVVGVHGLVPVLGHVQYLASHVQYLASQVQYLARLIKHGQTDQTWPELNMA